MDGFKNTTKMKYMGGGGMVDGYAKGGSTKPAMAKPMMKGGDAKPMMKGGAMMDKPKMGMSGSMMAKPMMGTSPVQIPRTAPSPARSPARPSPSDRQQMRADRMADRRVPATPPSVKQSTPLSPSQKKSLGIASGGEPPDVQAQVRSALMQMNAIKPFADIKPLTKGDLAPGDPRSLAKGGLAVMPKKGKR